MKKYIQYIGVSLAVAVAGVVLGACEKIDDVPPYKEASTSKAYKLPDPTKMTADETA